MRKIKLIINKDISKSKMILILCIIVVLLPTYVINNVRFVTKIIYFVSSKQVIKKNFIYVEIKNISVIRNVNCKFVIKLANKNMDTMKLYFTIVWIIIHVNSNVTSVKMIVIRMQFPNIIINVKE